MATWKALGSADKSLADVDPETVGNIYDESAHGIPPRGPYLVAVKRLQGLANKNGDPMFKFVAEIAEPAGSVKSKYNGYAIWKYQTINEQWAGAANSFLKAYFGSETPGNQKKLIQALWDKKVTLDDDEFVTKIGTKLIKDGVLIGVNTKLEKSEEYGDKLVITGYMPAKDAPKPVKAVDEDDEPDEDEEADVEVEDESEEDAEIEARREELAAMTLAALKKAAKDAGGALADYKALKGDDLVEYIIDLEFPIDTEVEDDEDEAEEEPEEDEDEPEDEEEGDEFDEMDRAELKRALKANSIEFKVTTKTTDDEIREALRAEPEADEEEDEEPEPPKARARATAAPAGRAAAKRRAGTAKAGADDEPPF